MTVLVSFRGRLAAVMVAGMLICLAGLLGVSRVGAQGGMDTIHVGESFELDGVTLTLERVVRGENETLVVYSYSAPSSVGVGPVGLPDLKLPSGKVLEGYGLEDKSRSEEKEDGLWRSVFKLPAIPKDVDSIRLALASHVVYHDLQHTTVLPLDKMLNDVDHSSVQGSISLEMNESFSVGDAQYILTSMTLEPLKFWITFKPANSIANKRVIAGMFSHARATDSSGSDYGSFLSVTRWTQNEDEVASQSLFFNGTLGADAKSLTLHVDGMGKIATPGSINLTLDVE